MSMVRPVPTWLAWVIGGLLAAGLSLLTGAWILAYWATHPLRIPVPAAPPVDTAPYEETTFTSADGVPLSGWFFPRAHARATIVLCHGHQFNRSQLIPVIRLLYDEPYQFLLFDFRRAGRSGGSVSGIGAVEWLDVIAAVDWLGQERRAAGKPIGAFGLSMGGAAVILAAAQDRRIAAVATHGAYADLDRAVRQRCRFLLGMLGPLLYRPVRVFGSYWLPGNPEDTAPSRVVGNITPRPVLLLHGSHDPFVAPEDVHILYRAAREPKRLVMLPHSWHVTVGANDEERYRTELRQFFRAALLDPR